MVTFASRDICGSQVAAHYDYAHNPTALQFSEFAPLEMTVECVDGETLPKPKPPNGATQSLLTHEEEEIKYRCVCLPVPDMSIEGAGIPCMGEENWPCTKLSAWTA